MKCNMCNKEIKDNTFRRILVYLVDEESIEQGSLDNCEKDLVVCNSCIVDGILKTHKIEVEDD